MYRSRILLAQVGDRRSRRACHLVCRLHLAAHGGLLCQSSFFHNTLRGQYPEAQQTKRVALPDQEPEMLPSVLGYLYKGDYLHLVHNKRRNSWELDPLPCLCRPLPSAAVCCCASAVGAKHVLAWRSMLQDVLYGPARHGCCSGIFKGRTM